MTYRIDIHDMIGTDVDARKDWLTTNNVRWRYRSIPIRDNSYGGYLYRNYLTARATDEDMTVYRLMFTGDIIECVEIDAMLDDHRVEINSMMTKLGKIGNA